MRSPAVHRFADRADVGIRVGVEELEEQAEVLRVALIRRRGQQQDVVGDVAQQLAKPIAHALVRLVRRRHAVRLVHDHQVPPHLPEARQDVLALGQVERGDQPVSLQPLVHPELLADITALENQELRVELLALPLEGQVGRADDQDALRWAAQLEFADEQAGHDRLPCAGVIGQEKAHAGELEQMVVDRLELMR